MRVEPLLSCLIRAALVFAVIFTGWLCPSLQAEVVPASRLTAWGGNVGVPGGIPNRTTIYTTLNPGATAAQIQAAIQNCPAGQVVYLNAGTYDLGGSQIRLYAKNDWTLRGAGLGKTIITGSGNTLFAIGQAPWLTQWPTPHNITSGATAGSISITTADGTSGINVGELMWIEQPNTGAVFGFGDGGGSVSATLTSDRMNNNAAVVNVRVMVKSISGNTITFDPPLPFTFDGSPRVAGYGGVSGSKNFGIEDLTLKGSTSAGTRSVDLTACYGAWFKNVEFVSFNKRGVTASWGARLEMRGCYIHEGAYGHDNGYSVECNALNNSLFEDNIWYKCQASHFLQGGCNANVIAYNVVFNMWNLDSGIDWLAGGFVANHSPYPMYNLYEGNYVSSIQPDFYYGGSRYGTILRNFIAGTDVATTQHRQTVSIDSRQWDYSVVGNVLGVKTTPSSVYLALPNVTLNFAQVGNINWTHGVTTTDQYGYAENRIFRLGYPGIGNNGYSGTGDPPAPGTALHALDLSVKPGHSHETIIHGNWDAANQTVTWHSGITDTSIPNTFYLSGKPAYFGSLAWPPFNPFSPPTSVTNALASIPAGYRLLYGVNPTSSPGPVNQAPTTVASPTTSTTGLVPLTVTFSSSGSSDPEGTPLTYSWSFGDGTTSTAANPSHVYATAGSYVARLTVSDGTNSTLSAGINIAVTAPINLPPIVAVNATPKAGVMPLLVSFSSAGSSDPEGATLTYSWTFGDGSASTSANPSHTYSSAGNFTAKLTVSDGSNSVTSGNITIAVTATPTNYPPSAVASATPLSGSAPLAVAFSSAGSSDPEGATLTYSWTFGDGGTSTSANPSHTYTTNGDYAAQLTVSDGTNAVAATPIAVSVADAASGLVAAFSFDEGSGTTATDASGKANAGTISNATRTPAGKFGGALTFNGTNALVVVASSASLNVTNAMTQEAWVYPTASKSSWSTVIHRQMDAYYLHASSPEGAMRPAGGAIFNGTESYVAGTSAIPLNTWTHLATTYDGSTLKVYVNGVLSSSKAVTGPVQSTTNPLSIGGNAYGQYFEGLIDEVRIYNRPLSAAEIAADKDTPVIAYAVPAPPGRYTMPEILDFIESNRGAAPFTVNFRKGSTAWSPSWVVDYGDGSTSIEPQPHIYTNAGIYKASVRVLNRGGGLPDYTLLSIDIIVTNSP